MIAASGKLDLQRLEQELQDAFTLAEGLGWESHDPFDLLASPLLGPLQSGSTALARVAVQVGKRSGGRLRSVLRVPVHQEPKAIADFLRAAVLLTAHGRTWPERFVAPLADRLVAAGSRPEGGHAWGLGFPYTSRFVNVPSRTPNAYTTMAVVEALLDAAGRLEAAPVHAVEDGCTFLVDILGTFEHAGRRWLRYWPATEDRIVNIQAAAAALLARAGARLGDARLSMIADVAAETTLRAQRADGSWPYSDDRRGSFVDGFHTGFVLQGLFEYRVRRVEVLPGLGSAVDAGLRYFRDHLLTADGLPRGFAGGAVSLDAQNLAQCIQTLVVCGGGDDGRRAAIRTWERAAELGCCPLRPGAAGPSLRWSLGPGVLAAAHLLSAGVQTAPPSATSDLAPH